MFEFIAVNWIWLGLGAYSLCFVGVLVLLGSNTREEIAMYGARIEDLPGASEARGVDGRRIPPGREGAGARLASEVPSAIPGVVPPVWAIDGRSWSGPAPV